MCSLCEMRATQAKKGSASVSLIEALSNLSTRIDDVEEQQKHIIPYSRKELLDRLNSFKSLQDHHTVALSKRVDQLEMNQKDFDLRISALQDKAILKPDYNPEEVGLNISPIAKEGTFEWAIIHMKKGKRARREGDEFTYYFTQLGTLMQIHVDGDDVYEDKLD